MKQKDELVEIRKKAEKAVADMPEGDLKLKAFEVAFRHLLESRTRGTEEQPSTQRRRTGRRTRPRPEEPDLRGELPKRIFDLRNDDFFAEPRTARAVQRELKTRGFHYSQAAVQMALLRLTRRRLLRRVPLQEEGERGFGYVAP